VTYYEIDQPVFIVWVRSANGPELQIWTDPDTGSDFGLGKWKKDYILAFKKISYSEIEPRPSLDELQKRYSLASLL
jgi:hypothetical protein